MKTYKAHIEDFFTSKTKKQVHRSSAIFPLFSNPKMKTRITFLGYFEIKRNLKSVVCKLTLREQSGNTIFIDQFSIQKKAYYFELEKWIKDKEFIGSVEVEFFSKENLLFPFPAVVVCYESCGMLTFVHSAQRTFNDLLDEKTTPNWVQSGINFRFESTHLPFITLINGPKIASCLVEVDLCGHKIKKEFVFAPYELKVIPLDRVCQKTQFARIKASLPSIFTRFIGGNLNTKTNALSITHSYQATVDENEFVPSSEISFPLFPNKEHTLCIYPIFAKSEFEITFEIFSVNGKRLKTLPKRTFTKAFDTLLQIPIAPLDTLALLYCRAKGQVPERLKVGFDVSEHNLPCNICTNFQPFNTYFEHKTHSFKWTPFFPNSSFMITLTSFSQTPISIKATCYRTTDELTTSFSFELPSFGMKEIRGEQYRDFFKQRPGWITFSAGGAKFNLFYFSFNSLGVGADHGF
jgi:hypothetical protein